MKVLVACEESQEVCKAFRAKGHEAHNLKISITPLRQGYKLGITELIMAGQN